MCSVLQISRSTYYYKAKERQSEDDVTGAVIEIFEQNRSAYGTRKIKNQGRTAQAWIYGF